MPIEENPFGKVYEALWEMAMSHVRLADMVPEGNRASYGSLASAMDPVKKVIASADVPELVLVPSGITSGNLHANSSQSMVQRRYSFITSTGDFRARKLIFPIEFALCCALADWKQTLGVLSWHGKTFVKGCNLIDAAEGLAAVEQNRGLRGWSCVWSCSVDFWFDTATLRDELTIPVET